jgi:hypothetical protein
MSEIPCPRCGEPVPCGEELIGQTLRCPRCAVSLRLEVDAAGEPAGSRPPRRRRFRFLALALGLFLGGLGLGFWLGLAAAPEPGAGPGIHARSVSFFGSASNHVIVTDDPPGKPAPAPAGGKRQPQATR